MEKIITESKPAQKSMAERIRHAEAYGEEEDTLNPEEEEPIRADGEEHTDIAEVLGTTDLPCGIGETSGDCGLLDEDEGNEEPTGPTVESQQTDASGAASDVDTGFP